MYSYSMSNILTIYQENLPAGHVLVLASGGQPAAEAELARALRVACLSGRAAVLIDCRLLDSLTLAAARRLWAFHLRQWRRGGQLVLCHVSDRLRQMLHRAAARVGPGLCIAASLDEAADYADGCAG